MLKASCKVTALKKCDVSFDYFQETTTYFPDLLPFSGHQFRQLQSSSWKRLYIMWWGRKKYKKVGILDSSPFRVQSPELLLPSLDFNVWAVFL
ncbi:hypothetical protein Tco_0401758 [Tanacetum coccineum]